MSERGSETYVGIGIDTEEDRGIVLSLLFILLFAATCFWIPRRAVAFASHVHRLPPRRRHGPRGGRRHLRPTDSASFGYFISFSLGCRSTGLLYSQRERRSVSIKMLGRGNKVISTLKDCCIAFPLVLTISKKRRRLHSGSRQATIFDLFFWQLVKKIQNWGWYREKFSPIFFWNRRRSPNPPPSLLQASETFRILARYTDF